MSKPVIKIEDVSKMYRLGELGTGTLYRDLHRSWARLRGKSDPFAKVGVTNDREQKGGEYVWALKDINLEVQEGEILGIIGRNGAGKSTLLKLLSRVTAPTSGRIRAKGRIASLLEVGTGFHPELTGRENIYLNGAILGMRRWEIAKQLEEIVEFSGCAKYIDTPVKRYSSGMMVRLGFSVAAHLECEILIVDEVLAVGDAAFQKKCLGKLGTAGKEGKTVLFVSHNMGMMQELCEYGVWLDIGKINLIGDISTTVRRYLDPRLQKEASLIDLTEHPYRLPRMTNYMRSVKLTNEEGFQTESFNQSEIINLTLAYEDPDLNTFSGAGFIIHNSEGVRVGGGNTYMAFQPPHSLPYGGAVTFSIPAREFTPGTYMVTVSLGRHQSQLSDKVENCIAFDILQADIYGTGYLLTKEDGVASLDFRCNVEPIIN